MLGLDIITPPTPEPITIALPSPLPFAAPPPPPNMMPLLFMELAPPRMMPASEPSCSVESAGLPSALAEGWTGGRWMTDQQEALS